MIHQQTVANNNEVDYNQTYISKFVCLSLQIIVEHISGALHKSDLWGKTEANCWMKAKCKVSHKLHMEKDCLVKWDKHFSLQTKTYIRRNHITYQKIPMLNHVDGSNVLWASPWIEKHWSEVRLVGPIKNTNLHLIQDLKKTKTSISLYTYAKL